MGFSEACRDFYYGRLLPLVRESGLGALDPWDTGMEIPDPQAQKEVWGRFNMFIWRAQQRGNRSADGVLAVLDGTDVDSGTAS